MFRPSWIISKELPVAEYVGMITDNCRRLAVKIVVWCITVMYDKLIAVKFVCVLLLLLLLLLLFFLLLLLLSSLILMC